MARQLVECTSCNKPHYVATREQAEHMLKYFNEFAERRTDVPNTPLQEIDYYEKCGNCGNESFSPIEDNDPGLTVFPIIYEGDD